MTDFVVSGGRSSYYPPSGYDWGGQFSGSRATFFLPSDFSGPDVNALAITNLPITVLSSSPVSVNNSFFGMSVRYRANDALTGVTAQTVRILGSDGGIERWQIIQPTSSTDTSTWNWTGLDTWVNTNYALGRDMVFTLFGTPSWASARPNEMNAYSDQGTGPVFNRGIAAEPSDLTTWDYFCTAVATRYLGKIKYYEVWNEVNYQNDGTGTTGTKSFWTGTYAKLAEMVRRANQAIKAIDPTAKILSPNIQGWTTTSGASDTFFAGMMAASSGDVGNTPMSQWVDIIAVHLYLPGANRVQDLAGCIDRVNASKTTAGVSGLETWDTESAPIAPDMSGLTDARAETLLARTLVTMAAKGIARHIYYQYDEATMGINTRPAVIAYREQLVTLLKGTTILNATRFTDGRVAYWTTGGVVII